MKTTLGELPKAEHLVFVRSDVGRFFSAVLMLQILTIIEFHIGAFEKHKEFCLRCKLWSL